MRLLVPGIPEVMDDAGFHHQLAARAGDLLMAVQPEPDPAAQDLEGLVQVAVHMLPGPTGAGAKVQVGDDRRPVGVIGAQSDHRALTTHRVLELLTGMDMPPLYGRDGALGI